MFYLQVLFRTWGSLFYYCPSLVFPLLFLHLIPLPFFVGAVSIFVPFYFLLVSVVCVLFLV